MEFAGALARASALDTPIGAPRELRTQPKREAPFHTFLEE